jgi:hypothetical protein
LRDWVRPFWQPGQVVETYVLLDQMNAAIPAHMTYRMREAPGVQAPGTTVAQQSGSCRDDARSDCSIVAANRCIASYPGPDPRQTTSSHRSGAVAVVLELHDQLRVADPVALAQCLDQPMSDRDENV